MRFSVVKICLIAGAVSSLAACAKQESPQALGGPRGQDGGVVTAESRYGHGVVSGPVRRGANGQAEVRAPGGTWFACGRSCAETLRRETIDFWESRGGANNPPDGPGYLQRHW